MTLTYDDQHLPTRNGIPTLVKTDLRDFIKAIRNRISYLAELPGYETKVPQDKKLRYFGVGEYGELNQRPHYHLLVFNLPVYSQVGKPYNEKVLLLKTITEAWKKGSIDLGDVSQSSINYVCKYVFKQIQFKNMKDKQPPFRLMSLRPAIGSEYIRSHQVYHNNNLEFSCTKPDGRKIPIPRYYKRKIFGISKLYDHNIDMMIRNDYDEARQIEKEGNQYFMNRIIEDQQKEESHQKKLKYKSKNSLQ